MIDRRMLLFVMTMVVPAGLSRAQSLPGADTLTATAIADSQRVLQQLTEHVRQFPRDASAWHRLGMVAWSIRDGGKAAGVAGIDPTRLGRLADTSLRRAVQLAPDSVRYRLFSARFLYASDAATARTAARMQFEKAVEAARRGNDRVSLAEANLWLGRGCWGGYDTYANRYLFFGAGQQPASTTAAVKGMTDDAAEALDGLARLSAIWEQLTAENGGAPIDIGKILSAPTMGADVVGVAAAGQTTGMPPLAALGSFKTARMRLENSATALTGEFAGEADYSCAFSAFHAAYEADPGTPGVFRGLAMVYAERGLWENLETLASAHVRAFPRDSIAWMSLGLARHRLQQDEGARIAFDSAMATLGKFERERLDRWERVLRPGSPPPRTSIPNASLERLYWMLASPVWLDGSRTRIEFLARVAFAELRWTVEEAGLSGVQTDRGEVHIRYGSPKTIMAFGPVAAQMADITTFWLYEWGGIFAFRGAPGFKKSHIAAEDAAVVQAMEIAQPVRWDNMAPPRIDSLVSFAARFRHQPGTVDVLLAAALPAPDSIAQTMSVKGPVQRAFWLIAANTFDSRRIEGVHDTAGTYSTMERVPASTYVYRVESFGHSAKRAGRATRIVDASAGDFAPLGFGLSDVVVSARIPSNPGVMRARDLNMLPVATAVRRGSSLSLIWEVYELTKRDAAMSYSVTVSLERVRSAAGRIVARVVDAMAQAARVETEDDRVVISFDRSGAYAPAFVQNMALSLGETPAGTYNVKVSVTDKASGKTVARETRLEIRQ